jgi:cob(I)alamin adenosyltransferase
MKIYTRTGDQGETGLPGGRRMAKDAAPLETCGTVDELVALLGLVRAEALPEGVDRLLEGVQHELLGMSAELAGADPAARGFRALGPPQVKAIEEAIDRYQEGLEPLGEFILPAGGRAAAGLHLARTVCRRAERRLVTLARQGTPEIFADLTAYLNRLGDLLFVLARAVNAEGGYCEVPWRRGP